MKAGKLSRHRLDGIELADHGRYSRKRLRLPRVRAGKGRSGRRRQPGDRARRCRCRPVRVAHAWLWLAHRRGASGVQREDFIEDGTVLRVAWQASRDGRRSDRSSTARQASTETCPCLPGCGSGPGHARWAARPREREAVPAVQARSSSGSRTRPRWPGWLTGSRRIRYATPFASAMLARGVQITELAHFLGHRDINVTHQVYGHLLPSAAKRAVAALDAEFAEWSKSLRPAQAEAFRATG